MEASVCVCVCVCLSKTFNDVRLCVCVCYGEKEQRKHYVDVCFHQWVNMQSVCVFSSVLITFLNTVSIWQ